MAASGKQLPNELLAEIVNAMPAGIVAQGSNFVKRMEPLAVFILPLISKFQSKREEGWRQVYAEQQMLIAGIDELGAIDDQQKIDAFMETVQSSEEYYSTWERSIQFANELAGDKADKNGQNNGGDKVIQGQPGNITIRPRQLVFNAPLRYVYLDCFEIANSGGHRIGFTLKTTQAQRFTIVPAKGVLREGEVIYIFILRSAFNADTEPTDDDRVIVEWTNIPGSATKMFCHEWFHGNGVVRRKELSIYYNM